MNDDDTQQFDASLPRSFPPQKQPQWGPAGQPPLGGPRSTITAGMSSKKSHVMGVVEISRGTRRSWSSQA